MRRGMDDHLSSQKLAAPHCSCGKETRFNHKHPGRGYYDSEELHACEEAGITVTLPKPLTSAAP